MEEAEDYIPPLHSLMDGDYCDETTEEYDDGQVPYSLQLLMQQKKNNEMKKRYFRNEFTDN